MDIRTVGWIDRQRGGAKKQWIESTNVKDTDWIDGWMDSNITTSCLLERMHRKTSCKRGNFTRAVAHSLSTADKLDIFKTLHKPLLTVIKESISQ